MPRGHNYSRWRWIPDLSLPAEEWEKVPLEDWNPPTAVLLEIIERYGLRGVGEPWRSSGLLRTLSEFFFTHAGR